MNHSDSFDRRFHEGLCLAAGGNVEQARAAFVECVVGQPGRGQFVCEFLAYTAAQASSSRNSGGSSEASARALVLEVERAAAAANWPELFQRGPECLAANPNHLQTLLALAKACEATGYTQSEPCYWQAATRAAPDDASIQRQAAEAMARLGQYDDALAYWRRVEELDPRDENVTSEITSAVIHKVRQTAGLSGTSSNVNLSPDQGSLASRLPVYPLTALEHELAAGSRSLTPIQQLEAAVRDRPSIAEPNLRLAELYLEKDRDYDAERLLAKAKESTENDSRIVEMWEEVSLARHVKRVELADQELKKNDNPQARETAQQALRDRAKTELDIYRARVKRDPQNAESQYELGRRLMQTEKTREALEHLNKALADANWRCLAATEIARLHEQSAEIVPALHFYRLAADAATGAQSAKKRTALTAAARLAEKVRLTRLAQRYRAGVGFGPQ